MVTCQCRLGGEVSDGGHALSIVTPEEPCFNTRHWPRFFNGFDGNGARRALLNPRTHGVNLPQVCVMGLSRKYSQCVRQCNGVSWETKVQSEQVLYVEMAKTRANIASLETDVQDSPENESVSDRTQLSKSRIDLDA
jgi:hypothetical protein